MTNYLEILRLNHLGYSQRTIEATTHCSRHTVHDALAEMDKHDIQWPLDDDITNAGLERILFPGKYKNVCLYVEPDYPAKLETIDKIRLDSFNVDDFC